MSAISVDGLCPRCGHRASDYKVESHHFPPNTSLNQKYTVGRVLGEGGFGITYIGLDTTLQRRVAIKEYFPTVFVKREASITLDVTCYTGEKQTQYEKGKNEFLQEAQTLAKLDSIQEIVRVLDYFPANNTAYIVMEYLEGDTFSDILKQRGRIPASSLLPQIEPIFHALASIHQEGIIHRDISPDNLMFLKNGQIKLLDFGCARNVDSARTMTVMLKHGYAPLEQYSGHNQGPWTDIYSLSATIYRCITGQPPAKALERGEAPDSLIPPNQLGAALTVSQEQALLKGLALDAAARWRSVPDFHEALYGAPISSGSNPSDAVTVIEHRATETGGQSTTPPPIGGSKKLPIIIGCCCLALVTVFAIWLLSSAHHGDKEQDPKDDSTIGNEDVSPQPNIKVEEDAAQQANSPIDADTDRYDVPKEDYTSDNPEGETFSVVYKSDFDNSDFYPRLTQGQSDKISHLSAEELPRELADLSALRRDQIWNDILVPLASARYFDATLYGVVNAGWLSEVTQQGSEVFGNVSDMDESMVILRYEDKIITQDMSWNKNAWNLENPWLEVDDFDGDGASEIAVCTYAISGMGASYEQLWIYDIEDEKSYLPEFTNLDLSVTANWDSGEVILSGGQYSATTTVDEFIKDDETQHSLSYGNIVNFSYDSSQSSGQELQCTVAVVWGGPGGYLCADVTTPVIYSDGEYKLGDILNIRLYD